MIRYTELIETDCLICVCVNDRPSQTNSPVPAISYSYDRVCHASLDRVTKSSTYDSERVPKLNLNDSLYRLHFRRPLSHHRADISRRREKSYVWYRSHLGGGVQASLPSSCYWRQDLRDHRAQHAQHLRYPAGTI